MQSWVYYILDVVIVLVVFTVFVLWQRARNEKLVRGCIWAEFWPEAGRKWRKLCPILPNGIEITNEDSKSLREKYKKYQSFINAPTTEKGHVVPCYFFNKESEYPDMYPANPLFNLKILQVPVSTVAFYVRSPEPINPKAIKPYCTADMVMSVNDADTMAFFTAASEEIQTLQKQLADALTDRINKVVAYLLWGVGIIAAGAGAYISYMLLQNWNRVFGS